VPVQRIRRIAKENPALLEEIFTADERAYASRKARFAHLAACYAAKEAVLKALGTGFSRGIAPSDVEIRHDPSGRPVALLHGAAARFAADEAIVSLDVSLTHTGPMAAATAVAVRRGV